MNKLHCKNQYLTHFIFSHLSLFAALTVILWSNSLAASPETRLLEPQWRSRPAGSSDAGTPSGTGTGIDFNVDIPNGNETVFAVNEDTLTGWNSLAMAFELPNDFPEGLHVYFFTKDWDHLWRQVRYRVRPDENGFAKFDIPLTGQTAAAAWVPGGHNRPWHTLTPRQVREFGFRFANDDKKDSSWTGQVRLREIQLLGRLDKEAGLKLHSLHLNPITPKVGEVCEIQMAVDTFYDNPFDDSFTVRAQVSRPGGQTDEISGFYYEGFIAESRGLKDQLIPHGKPQYRVRYTPRETGKHSMAITISGRHGETTLPPITFEAQPPDNNYRGFIRLDPENPLFMEFENGEVFQGIGLNIRTPYDLRYLSMIPHSGWRDEGLNVYRKMFPKLAAAGVNTVEVWMASWWLALEWINDAPGFHGVGYYNQYRAWLLDELVELAEENDIYLILVLNNHGKFSEFCDEEWDRNPYNRRNGGWLNRANEYFTNEPAREAFKRTADYIVARWGHSPNILAWKLFSEIDLTGSFQGSYRQPFMRNWHDEMAKYLKQIDPYDHLITTHWSQNYTVINDAIADLDSLDFLTTDAYAGSTLRITELFGETVNYAAGKNKPAIITEFGGSPMGDTLGALKSQLHISLWDGFFSGHTIVPMLWWFGLVEEKDLYGHYAALAAFADGIDRRRFEFESQHLGDANLYLKTLKSSNAILLWWNDRSHYLSSNENRNAGINKDLVFTVTGLSPDNYRIEFWDCASTEPIDTRMLTVHRRNQEFEIDLPPFSQDFAVRILPRSR